MLARVTKLRVDFLRFFGSLITNPISLWPLYISSFCPQILKEWDILHSHMTFDILRIDLQRLNALFLIPAWSIVRVARYRANIVYKSYKFCHGYILSILGHYIMLKVKPRSNLQNPSSVIWVIIGFQGRWVSPNIIIFWLKSHL